MNHFYESVEGWFDPSDKLVYDIAIDKFKNEDIFIEVGSFKGRSSSAMAVNIINSKKNIKFYCVDTWNGSEEHQKNQQYEDKDVVDNRLYEVFLENTKSIKDYIIPIRKKSTEAAKDFADNSIAFIYIDASHDYENVKMDIETWYPKIKSGGILGGHDYMWDGVRKAVNEFCDIHKLHIYSYTSWYIEKK